MSFLIYNTTVCHNDELPFNPLNRAFYYGDGFFESILVLNNNIRFLDDHYKRMINAFSAFNLEIPIYFSQKFIQESILLLSFKNGINDNFRIKINFWRNGTGFYTPNSNATEIVFTISNFSPSVNYKKNCFFYEEIKTNYSIISPFKTLNAAIYTLSSIAKMKLQADEMILLDTNFNVSECTNSNLFFIKNDVVYTPSLQCGCIDGVMRKQIIKYCNKNKIEIREGKFTKIELLQSDFVFTSNISGLIPILIIEQKQFSPTSFIFDALKTINN